MDPMGILLIGFTGSRDIFGNPRFLLVFGFHFCPFLPRLYIHRDHDTSSQGATAQGIRWSTRDRSDLFWTKKNSHGIQHLSSFYIIFRHLGRQNQFSRSMTNVWWRHITEPFYILFTRMTSNVPSTKGGGMDSCFQKKHIHSNDT